MGYVQVVENDTLIRQTEVNGGETEVCAKKNKTVTNKERIYRGTLNGGLFLDTKLMKGFKRKPAIGMVDDLGKDPLFNVEKMKREHNEKPEHFGIHLSKLKSLENDRVKDRETEIISDIF